VLGAIVEVNTRLAICLGSDEFAESIAREHRQGWKPLLRSLNDIAPLCLDEGEADGISGKFLFSSHDDKEVGHVVMQLLANRRSTVGDVWNFLEHRDYTSRAWPEH
jgi:hypothetical protein